MFYNTDIAGKAGVLGSNGQLQEVTSPPQEFKAMALEMQKVTKPTACPSAISAVVRKCGACSTPSTSNTARTWN